jgi:hypothetical protein
MPLTLDEYRCLRGFSVLYSGGLDSAAVAILMGGLIDGPVHLLTYKHQYGALFNEWSRRHNSDLVRILGDRVFHNLIDLTETWDALGANRILREIARHRGHWVVCLGCQQSMATHTILYNLEHGLTNAFICSSVGGEYAVMSMGVTRERNTALYARYGIRYNAPLLDLGVHKNEERRILHDHGVEPGWGRRRSHQGYQPICLLGFQHGLDILVDFHTTYPPQRIASYLDEKAELSDQLIRALLRARGHEPDRLIEANLARYAEEEAAIQRVRAAQADQQPP